MINVEQRDKDDYLLLCQYFRAQNTKKAMPLLLVYCLSERKNEDIKIEEAGNQKLIYLKDSHDCLV